MTLAALMLGATMAAGASAAPSEIVIATARGETAVLVTTEFGHPTLSAPTLARLLPVTGQLQDNWAVVTFAGQPFRFLLGAPVMDVGGVSVPLVGGAYVVRDTLFVPLQWLAEFVPRMFREGYRYDPLAARFEEARLTPVVTSTTSGALVPAGRSRKPPTDLERRNGFRMHHLVVVDAGHGGPDDGNPGLFFPKGVKEKHVTLAIAKDVQLQLEAKGIEVLMTRTTDTLIYKTHRAPMCRLECDLFASIHVNSLPRRPGYQDVKGFQTYFIGHQVTQEANRVAAMENEALRFESEVASADTSDDPLAFILRDLQTNEFLRESALLAEAIQTEGARVLPGGSRGAQQSPLFAVLRTARRPAVLVETGFATNPEDGRFLASRDGQKKIAAAIADGIVSYLKQYELKVLGAP